MVVGIGVGMETAEIQAVAASNEVNVGLAVWTVRSTIGRVRQRVLVRVGGHEGRVIECRGKEAGTGWASGSRTGG